MQLLKILFLFSFLINISCSNNKEIEISKLLCEYQEYPNNIDVSNPKLSWQLKSSKNGQRQSAYQILVSSNKETISKKVGDLWDSGKIISSQSSHIKYEGNTLSSNTTVYWKVRVWDKNDNISDYSYVAHFTTSILSENEWKAKWIGKEINVDPNNEYGYYNSNNHKNSNKVNIDSRSLLLRKEIVTNKNIIKAIVHVTGLGYYELQINGKKIGDYLLAPAKTFYKKSILYDSFDITSNLNQNKNVIGIELGNGWFNPLKKWWSWRMQWYGDKRAYLQLHILYDDDSSEILVSDETWKYHKGPILSSCIYDGEMYDAREEIKNWSSVNYNDSSWKNVDILKSPGGKLVAQRMQSIKRIEEIKPIGLSSPKENIFVYDLGQNFSGWAKLFINGKKGDLIKIKYAENINKNGLIDNTTNILAEVTDQYILKGSEKEIYEPKFTYHGFRYVQIEGLTNPPTINDLLGIVVHTAVEKSGEFNCSNNDINKIHKATLWSQRSNLMGFPTDCPQRDERLGWIGDAHVTAEEAIFNFNMPLFYKKWLNDIQENQKNSSGEIAYISPRPFTETVNTVAWSSGYALIVWYNYCEYGNKDILSNHYNSMKEYVEYLTSIAKDNILQKDKYGDWLSPNESGWWKPGIHKSVSTGYYYYITKILAKSAKILEKKNDSKYYNNLAEKIKEAYNKEFFNSETKVYENGSQFAYSFPLFLDIVPQNEKIIVLEKLINVINGNRGHLSTGILGTKNIIEALSINNRNDIAYLITTRREYPSWIDMLKNRTTLSENWNPASRSNNHVMFGSIDSWFYKGLAGINSDENNPGFNKVIIKPYIPSNLEFVNSHRETIKGKVASSWEIIHDDLILNVEIPVNSSATIYLPAIDSSYIYYNEKEIKDSENVQYQKSENNYCIYSISSGIYKFVSKKYKTVIPKQYVDNPIIKPNKDFFKFGDKIKVSLSSVTEDSKIYYTVDESEPNRSSKLYSKPLFISKTSVVKSRAFKNNYNPSFTTSKKYNFIDEVNNGLTYKLYKGSWKKLPDFKLLKAVSKGKTYDLDLSKIETDKFNFALEFNGFIKIDTEGKYTLYLKSNDGSRLIINNNTIIDNDLEHAVLEKKGSTYLVKGKHPITVLYFQSGGSKSLELLYKGPNIEKQVIQSTSFFNKK